MKTKPKAIPPDLRIKGVDGERNHDFDKVPSAEIELCCLWEYARESDTIRSRVLTPEEERDYLREHEEDFDLLLDKYSFPAPWLSLLQSEREWRTEFWNSRHRLRKGPPVTPGHWGIVKHCLDLARRSAFAQSNLPVKYTPDIFRTEVNPVSPPPPNLPETEVLLSINWYGYGDKAIKRALNQWVDKNRPRSIHKRRRGRRRGFLNYKAALRCLALMRVLRDHSPKEASYSFSSVWVKKYRRVHTKALKNFHKLFPGLHAELLLSWRQLDK